MKLDKLRHFIVDAIWYTKDLTNPTFIYPKEEINEMVKCFEDDGNFVKEVENSDEIVREFRGIEGLKFYLIAEEDLHGKPSLQDETKGETLSVAGEIYI